MMQLWRKGENHAMQKGVGMRWRRLIAERPEMRESCEYGQVCGGERQRECVQKNVEE